MLQIETVKDRVKTKNLLHSFKKIKSKIQRNEGIKNSNILLQRKSSLYKNIYSAINKNTIETMIVANLKNF